MADNANPFEGFDLDAEKKILRRGGEIVPLPPKAVELLIVLLKHRGEVVSKNELLETVWERTFVEESVLSNNIYILRKTLSELGAGKNLIQTVPRRGYRLNPEVIRGDSEIVLEHHVFEQTVIECEKVEDSPSAEREPKQLSRPAPLRVRQRFLAIAVFLILATSGFVVWRFGATPAAVVSDNNAAEIKSITVLPLKPLAGAAAAESDKVLSLGLADALIVNLGTAEKMVVRPTSSITKYADSDFDALEVGRKLQTDAVLDGSFQRADNRLRVSVRLIRVADGKQIWAGTFDETERDVFKLQDKISAEAATALALNFNRQTRELVFKRYTENVEAYQAYLRGRYLFSHRGSADENLYKAIAEFEQALLLDKNYALAFAGLADAQSRLANNSESGKRREYYEKARANAQTALRLDENLAEAHAAIGWIYRIYDWDWANSAKHLKRAIELAPNVAFHYRLYAYLLITVGKTAEAVEYNKQAKRLDPSESDAWALFCNRQYEEAAEGYATHLRLADTAETRRGLAMAYSELGKNHEAIDLLEKVLPEQRAELSLQVVSAIAHFRAGKITEAEKLLSVLEEKAQKGSGQEVRLASVYAVMNKKDKALAALEKALEETRDDRLMWIKTSSYLDPLRGDSRFHEILRKMNLN